MTIGTISFNSPFRFPLQFTAASNKFVLFFEKNKSTRNFSGWDCSSILYCIFWCFATHRFLFLFLFCFSLESHFRFLLFLALLFMIHSDPRLPETLCSHMSFWLITDVYDQRLRQWFNSFSSPWIYQKVLSLSPFLGSFSYLVTVSYYLRQKFNVTNDLDFNFWWFFSRQLLRGFRIWNLVMYWQFISLIEGEWVEVVVVDYWFEFPFLFSFLFVAFQRIWHLAFVLVRILNKGIFKLVDS